MTQARLVLLLLAGALAGCGSTYFPSAIRDADQRAQAAYADCDAQLRSGALKSHRQAVDCAKPKVLLTYQQNGYPYMDLVNLDLTARTVGADEIDTGFATEADINRDIAELDRRIGAERQRRVDAEKGFGGSATPTPVAQMLAGLTALTGGSNAPTQTSSTCFKVGTFSHCDQ